MTIQQRRLLIVGLAILAVGILGYSIFYYIRQLDHIPLRLVTVPSSATVTLDSKSYGNGTIWLIPGTYTLTVSKDGFETYSEKITVAKGDKNITAGLAAQSEEAKAWADKNSKAYEELEVFANEQSDIAIERQVSRYPELAVLPYSLPAFTIESRASDSGGTPTIVITGYDGSRNAAVQQLYELGIDPADYPVEFTEFTNPFKERTNE